MHLPMLCFKDWNPTVSSLVPGLVLVRQELLHECYKLPVLQVGLQLTGCQIRTLTGLFDTETVTDNIILL